MIYNAKLICLLLFLFFSFVSFATWLRMSITILSDFLQNILFLFSPQISFLFLLINLHQKELLTKKTTKRKKYNDFVSIYQCDHILNARNVKKLIHSRIWKMMRLIHHFSFHCFAVFSLHIIRDLSLFVFTKLQNWT